MDNTPIRDRSAKMENFLLKGKKNIRYAHVSMRQTVFLSVAPNLSQAWAQLLPLIICQKDQVMILLSS